MRVRSTLTALRRSLWSCPYHRSHTALFARNLTTTPCRQRERLWSTPLAKQLFEAISTTGTVPLASYMRMCLTGDVGGYYTGALGQSRDQFGTRGDFVTSPEISQIFGELVAIWFIAEWISQGQPRQGLQLIEVGPGRGTLMDDMLRTMQNFPAIIDSIEAVYMVETSHDLRIAQKNLLCGPEAASTESGIGSHGVGKYSKVPIVWTPTIKSIPIEPDKTPFIVAHEFFDALPIHAFQAVNTHKPCLNSHGVTDIRSPMQSSNGSLQTTEWREMMVSPTPPSVSQATLGSVETQQPEPKPEFQLSLSPGTTRHSRYLPESSPRYRKLKHISGSLVEICPDAAIYAADFAARIGGSLKHPKPKPSGAALILDYGTSDTIPINSLRGVKEHKIVDPFYAPGLVDLSADVDFTALAEAAILSSDGVEVHGPVTQAKFLGNMGIRERAKSLINRAGSDKKLAESVDRGWKRLVDCAPSGMGKVYKALAILPENDGKRRPAGFGGDVQGS